MPHKGDWLQAKAQTLAHAFNHPLNGVAGSVQAGALPAQDSFVQVSPGSVALSTIKRSEDGQAVIVRLWNPSGANLPEARVRFYRQPVSVRLANLLESPQSPELTSDAEGWFSFELGPHKIVTLRVEF
jgi:alpha-mannosidase